jgi:hypothetical protein
VRARLARKPRSAEEPTAYLTDRKDPIDRGAAAFAFDLSAHLIPFSEVPFPTAKDPIRSVPTNRSERRSVEKAAGLVARHIHDDDLIEERWADGKRMAFLRIQCARIDDRDRCLYGLSPRSLYT